MSRPVTPQPASVNEALAVAFWRTRCGAPNADGGELVLWGVR